MRAIVERVSSAQVAVAGRCIAQIEQGLLAYVGVGRDDTTDDADYVAEKIRHLRIFEDADGRLNRDVNDISGQILMVSAFTLLADARKGRRPALAAAAPADTARVLFDRVCDELAGHGATVQRGAFRETMQVQATNDGPVCILLDSHKQF